MHSTQHVAGKGGATGTGHSACAVRAREGSRLSRSKSEAHGAGVGGNFDVVVLQPYQLAAERQVVLPFYPKQIVSDVVGVGYLGIPGIPAFRVDLVRG